MVRIDHKASQDMGTLFMETIRTPCIIFTAFILDCIIGDPQNRFHPVRVIGYGVSLGTAAYKKAKIKTPIIQFIMGMVLTLIIVSLSYAAARFVTWSFYRLNYWIGLILEAVICRFLYKLFPLPGIRLGYAICADRTVYRRWLFGPYKTERPV